MKKIINIILMWIFVLNTSVISLRSEIYKSTEIFTIPWGSNTGQVGKNMQLYNFNTAIPTNIKIDSERKRLYLFDHVNQKIEAFNYSGQHVLSFPVEEYLDIIKLDKQGNIYICIPGDDFPLENFGGTQIRVYDPTGKRLDTYNHPVQYFARDSYPFIKMIDETDIVVTNSIIEWRIPIESVATEIKKSAKKCYYSSPVKNKYIYSIEIEPINKAKNKKGYRYLVVKRDKNNKIVKGFPLTGGETFFRLLGVDKNDAVYIIQDYLKSRNIKVIITKYNSSGKLIANFHLNEEYCQKGMEREVYNVVDIDSDGLIFQMVNKENGILILKWEKLTN